jgi:hypothetical protein
MKIDIKSPGKNNNLLMQICLVFFGIFTSCIVFSISLNIFGTAGLWVGIMLNLLIVSLIFYYLDPGRSTRIIGWSILATLIIAAAIYSYLIYYVNTNLDTYL